MPQQIQVQTVPGRPGVRTGYMVGGTFTPNALPQYLEYYRYMGVQPKKAEVKPETPTDDIVSGITRTVQLPSGVIVFAQLPRHDGGRCVNCRRRLGWEDVAYEKTDQGKKEIATCPGCQTKMRVD